MPRVIVRRRSGRAPAALTAAAQRVDGRNPTSFRSSPIGGAGSVNWQEQAWFFLEKVGELEYYVSWRSASASRCHLVASALDDQGEPTGTIAEDDPNAERVRQIVNDIADGVSGQIKIMARASYLLTVVGECWIGMVVRDASRETAIDGNTLPVDITRPGYQVEQWYVFGRDDIKASQSGIELKLPDGTKHEFNSDVDILFRVWDEHPKDPSKPVSPIWANRDVLAALVQSAATVSQANNSRLIGNGILFVPQEMSLPTQAPAPSALPNGEPDTNIPDPFFEANAAQSLQDLLYDVATAAKKDPNSEAAQLPIVAAVPGEMIKNVNWLRAGSDIPETTLKIEEFDIRRLATGLHVAPERLLGMAQGNHWTGWLIDESDVKVHIAPVVEIIANALTQEVLRQKLAEENIDPDAYIVWYDASSLTQDPDKSDEAQAAFDRGALSARALREHLGFDDADGYDLSTADGWIQLALDKVAQDPANAGVFGKIIEVAAQRVGLEVSAPAAALPPGNSPAEEDDPADAEPEEPDADPADTDADPPSQTAAVTIARIYVDRALELANKRRRTRAVVDIYRDTPIERVHTLRDPVPLAECAELIRGWSTGLHDGDLLALGLAPDPFRALVEGAAHLALATSSAPIITNSMIRRADVPAQ